MGGGADAHLRPPGRSARRPRTRVAGGRNGARPRPGHGRGVPSGARLGWVGHPHRSLRGALPPPPSSIDALFDVARRAGFADAVVVERPVDVGVRDPESLVAWRTGLAQLSPFVDGLDADRRTALLEECRVAVGDDPPPLVPLML